VVVQQVRVLVLALVAGLQPQLLRYHRDYFDPAPLKVLNLHRLDLSDPTVLAAERLPVL